MKNEKDQVIFVLLLIIISFLTWLFINYKYDKKCWNTELITIKIDKKFKNDYYWFDKKGKRYKTLQKKLTIWQSLKIVYCTDWKFEKYFTPNQRNNLILTNYREYR